MTQTPNPPAGWYPQGNQERWWDGTGWSDNFRPLGSEPDPAARPADDHRRLPATRSSSRLRPADVRPAAALPRPSRSRRATPARNILIVFGVLFLLFVGGCVAVVAVVGNEVNDAVNDDTARRPQQPAHDHRGRGLRGRRVRVRRRLGHRRRRRSAACSRSRTSRSPTTAARRTGCSPRSSCSTATRSSPPPRASAATSTRSRRTPRSPSTAPARDTLPTAYDKITIQDAI